MNMKEIVQSNVLAWIESNIDQQSKNEILELLKNDEKELVESFYRSLEFGTGGMRGKMGVGTNRLNRYTIGLATQGFANYLKKNFKGLRELKVVIAYDTRNNSKFFAQTVAEVFAANDIKAFLFENFRPTPELSFAIRNLNAQGGVVVTASHNPKEYNGYKVYWEDGGQVIAPHDIGIIEEVQQLTIADINFNGNNDKIQIIGDDIDSIYLAKLKEVSINPEIIRNHSDLKIVYTPLHGTGVDLLPKALNLFGFDNVSMVEQQAIPDGNFPTVKSPNPENAEALEMAIKKAKEIDGEIVLATDPDADRIGVAVKNSNGEFILLNGNQTGSILTYYIINNLSNKNKLTAHDFIVKTIVTTELIQDIASKHNVKTYNVLTGFKYIAALMREKEIGNKFLGGFEESYGYLFGNFVRDKDAIMSGALICEAAAWAKEKGKTFYDLLIDIYIEFGFYKESLVNLVREGKEGADEINEIMQNFRDDAPALINDVNVVIIRDFLTGNESNLFNGKQSEMGLPSSNVLQFVMEDMTKITIRPSGTEPKIKFYISIKDKIKSKDDYAEAEIRANKLIESYKIALGI
ncbi:MAG: phospho-sugar mutase [Bacteroidales bacterium]|nr:phospho-sugar mutase [Bacteroidales bacterium]